MGFCNENYELMFIQQINLVPILPNILGSNESRSLSSVPASIIFPSETANLTDPDFSRVATKLVRMSFFGVAF